MRRPHSLSSLRLLRLCSVQANDTCILTPVSSACSHALTERDGDRQGLQVGVSFYLFREVQHERCGERNEKECL